MPASTLKKDIERLNSAIGMIISKKISLSQKPGGGVTDFKERKREYYIKNFQAALKSVKLGISCLQNPPYNDSKNRNEVSEILILSEHMDSIDTNNIKAALEKISALIEKLDLSLETKAGFIKIPKNIPDPIRLQVSEDLKEIEKCFNAGCYRSAAIMCGRVLEAALHRKYYEVTGEDILEKNPGIGLGKLIAKLDEKKIKFEPGLTQQIHLINQLRIFSVHIKQETFYPSHQQAQAMILYSLDVLGKIFNG